MHHNPALLWLGITLLVWWTGLAGRELYLLPALIFLGIFIYQIWKKWPLNISTQWICSSSGKLWLITIFLVHVVLYLTITILKYY